MKIPSANEMNSFTKTKNYIRVMKREDNVKDPIEFIRFLKKLSNNSLDFSGTY